MGFFRYRGHEIEFPLDVPATRVFPDDIGEFLTHMNWFILRVIRIDPVVAKYHIDEKYVLRSFERHILAPSQKKNNLLRWQTYDAELTSSSYQIWFAFKLTKFLEDNLTMFIKTSPPPKADDPNSVTIS
jgi:hypothetical protein